MHNNAHLRRLVCMEKTSSEQHSLAVENVVNADMSTVRESPRRSPSTSRPVISRDASNGRENADLGVVPCVVKVTGYIAIGKHASLEDVRLPAGSNCMSATEDFATMSTRADR